VATKNKHRILSDDCLDHLALYEPLRLLELLKDPTLHDADLSFAAEKAGTINLPEVRVLLVELLEHESAVVREGAVYGLAASDDSIDDEKVLSALRRHWSDLHESSPGVRAAAVEVVQSLYVRKKYSEWVPDKEILDSFK